MINVTKTFLPPLEEYTSILKRAWDKSWITNNGELVQELENDLRSYLGVKNLIFCNNGTIALQLALKALDITGEVITTPFSYVATTSAILWENCKPVFVDIDENNFCINASKIEAAITSETQAILATHVYGYPCDVEAISLVAKRHDLKVIYDAAHAFGTKVNGRSILSYGDISTCSFHATKLFHTGEGGCIVTSDDELSKKLFLYSHFGHVGDEHYSIGINGKNSEMHAALGLCNLRYVTAILESRQRQWIRYRELLKDTSLQMLVPNPDIHYNHAYFPLVFASEDDMLASIKDLAEINVLPRRYFYPALNTLPYINHQHCPVAESIAGRVLCLPLFYDLEAKDQDLITKAILKGQKQKI